MNGYNDGLAKEWIDWVEAPDSQGSREREIIPFIKKWLEELKPKVLCDIGCGQGYCSDLIIGERTRYIGIDPSSMLLKRAEKQYSSLNKQFIEGTASNVPLENEAVDAIISVWVWSHLENLTLASKEMFRILKPKGKFLLVTANPETYEERKTFYKKYTIEDNLLKGDFDLGGGKVLSNTTLYLHSKDDIEQAIKQAGFEINYTKRVGLAETCDKGLYLVIEGSKLKS